MGLFDAIFGGSEQSSQSTSQSRAQSFIDPNQAAQLSRLWANANALGNLQQSTLGAGGAGSAFNLASSLGGQGQGILDQLTGPGALFNQASGGAGAISPFLGQGPVNAQIGALGSNLGQFFDQGLNSIQSRFGQSGALGSRAGLQGGQLLGQFGNAFAQGAAGILGNDANRQTSAAIAQGGLLNQDLARQQQGQIQGGGLGLNSLGGLFNLGAVSPFAAQFAPLNQFSNILGSPTVLNNAVASGSSSGSGSSTPGIMASLFPFGL